MRDHKISKSIGVFIASFLLLISGSSVGAATEEVVFFDGDVSNGWSSEWSWDVTFDRNKVTAKPWGGVYIRYVGGAYIDADAINYLNINLKSDEEVLVSLVCDCGNQPVHKTRGNVHLSLNELVYPGVTQIHGIMIQSTFKAHTYNLNKVALMLNRPLAKATATPSFTPLPPTATATNQPPATATNTPVVVTGTPRPTVTNQPPATSTPIISPTGLPPLPVTATSTPIVVTGTPLPTATNQPPATNTPVVNPTDFPTATATSTPTNEPAQCLGRVQEAEGGRLFGMMRSVVDGDASSGNVIYAKSGRGAESLSPDHRAEYCVRITQAGTYKIVGRVLAKSDGSNSMYVKVDDSPVAGMVWHMSQSSVYADIDVSSDGNVEGGNPAQAIYLSRGDHTLSFYYREAGVRLDRFEVVPAGEATPTPEPERPTATPLPPTPTPRPPSGANVFFVSPKGNNRDGKTWATAWNELDQIRWDRLQPGNVVYIDGGSSSMVYKTMLRPSRSGSQDKPIVLKLSGEVGRAGQARFFGGNGVLLPECGQKSWDSSQHSRAKEYGIYIKAGTSNLVIDGRKKDGIQLHGWTKNGIHFDSGGSSNITLRHMEIYNNGGVEWKDDGGVRVVVPSRIYHGIRVVGRGHRFEHLNVHDNGADAIQGSNIDDFSLTDSWLYNQRPHSGKDNNPADVCTAGNRSGCDELGAPQMGPDYWDYSNTPRRESFNWCTHSDGLQIRAGDAMNGMRIERSMIGPNFMTGLLLGERDGSQAWINNLAMRDVVITRFMHNGMGMKNPASNAGQNWDLQNVTIYGHRNNTQKVSLHADWTGGGRHQIKNTIVVHGHVKLEHAHIDFSNNCQWQLYGGSLNGSNANPDFRRIDSRDVFEGDINVDFATVFKDDYTPLNSRCSSAGSRLTTASGVR